MSNFKHPKSHKPSESSMLHISLNLRDETKFRNKQVFEEAIKIATRRNNTKLAYLGAIDDIREELGL